MNSIIVNEGSIFERTVTNEAFKERELRMVVSNDVSLPPIANPPGAVEARRRAKEENPEEPEYSEIKLGQQKRILIRLNAETDEEAKATAIHFQQFEQLLGGHDAEKLGEYTIVWRPYSTPYGRVRLQKVTLVHGPDDDVVVVPRPSPEERLDIRQSADDLVC